MVEERWSSSDGQVEMGKESCWRDGSGEMVEEDWWRICNGRECVKQRWWIRNGEGKIVKEVMMKQDGGTHLSFAMP